MNFCATHFDAITASLKRRNLWRFVSNDKERMKFCAQAWERASAPPRERPWVTTPWASRSIKPSELDPLVVALSEITKSVAELCHVPSDRPDACPLCLLAKVYGAPAPEAAIRKCLNSIVELFEEAMA